MKRLVIAITAFMVGWYICGFFVLQALGYFFPSFLLFNDWIANILWPVYLRDIFTYLYFPALCLGGVGLILPFRNDFTVSTVITHNRRRYHRRYRKRRSDEITIKRFIKLVSILTICIFVFSLIFNALFYEDLALIFSSFSFVFLGMIYGTVIIQKSYGTAR